MSIICVQRYLDELGWTNLSSRIIARKRRVSHDHLVFLGAKQDEADHVNQLIAAITHHQISSRKVQFVCQGFFQIKRSAVRINMHFFGCSLNGGNGFRRRAERVLIAGELYYAV